MRTVWIPETRLKVLLALIPILAAGSLAVNWHIIHKRQMLAGKELIQRIETAKKRANKLGDLPEGFWATYKQLEPHIYRYEKRKPMEELTLGSKNGTGKNIVRWGNFKKDGTGKPAELGDGPPVKK